MIGRLVDWALANRLLVAFALLLLLVAGVRAALVLPVDAVPDITNEQVQILTVSQGLAPEAVERFVTFPVEVAVNGIARVAQIRSVSVSGLSSVTVVFEDGTDIYWARQQVSERLAQARDLIPAGFGSPELAPISTGLGEVYQFEVRGDPACRPGEPDTEERWSLTELRTLLDWDIAYRLRAVPGVADVNSMGGEVKRYEVRIDPARMFAHGIGMEDVTAALEQANLATGGGAIEHREGRRIIRGEALLATVDDIRAVVIRSEAATGAPLTVGMVAEVAVASVPREGLVTRDGRGEAVVGVAMMLKGGNSRVVAKRVAAALQDLKKSLPAGVRIEPFYDRSELVDRTVRTATTNLVEGGVLVVLVLLLLLGNVRAGLVVAAAIPLSMLGALVLMDRFSISGNLMSLGAIDFGLIVDGSVVMVESILRRLEERPPGVSITLEVREAALEVARPVTFAVAIIMIVYLPILSLEGVEGKMFRPMALTVVFALATSLLVALLAAPALASVALRKARPTGQTPAMRLIERGYRPALGWAQAHPRTVVSVAAAMLVASVGIFATLGSEFIPRLDEGSLAMEINRLPSTSLEQTIAQTTALERTLLSSFPDEVATVVSKTGRAEIATDVQGIELSDIYIGLKARSAWRRAHSRDELVARIAPALEAAIPGVAFSYSQPIELRFAELIAGVRADVAVTVFGPDIARLQQLAGSIVRVLDDVPGAADVRSEQVAGLAEAVVQVDRAAAARHGVTARSALDVVQAARSGRDVGVILEGQPRFPLTVTLAPSAVREGEDLLAVPVASQGGRLVPLGEVATLTRGESANQISHEAVSRRVAVSANVRGRDLGSFVRDAQRAVEKRVVLPPGYHVAWGGQFENLARATARLRIVVPVALVAIFFFLFMSFGSARLAALVFVNVPLAVIGGVLALAVRGMPFSISAGVGFIALFGVAVLNGVVMMAKVQALRRDGLDPQQAARSGALARLRPVLTTALVASLGFVPMAVATSAGAEVQRPLATVVIGGLITSTLLTLIVLPAIYRWFDREERPGPDL